MNYNRCEPDTLPLILILSFSSSPHYALQYELMECRSNQENKVAMDFPNQNSLLPIPTVK